MDNTRTPRKTWADYERERLALQRFSPRFSRAELCRRAGISDTTMLKGLKAETLPRRSKTGRVARVLEEERQRLTPGERQQLELVLAAEGVMVEEGLRK